MKVTLVGGAGGIGSSVAFNLLLGGGFDVVLVDPRAEMVSSHVMDLEQVLEQGGSGTVRAGGDADVLDADVVVLSAGAPLTVNSSRMVYLEDNAAIIGEVVDALPADWGGVVLLVTNPVDPLCTWALPRTGLDRGRLLGYTLNDTLRLRTGDRDRARRRARERRGLGDRRARRRRRAAARPRRVAGRPVELNAAERAAAEDFLRDWYVRHVELDSGRSSTWTSGLGIARLVRAIAADSGELFPVSIQLEGEYGIEGVCLSVPAAIGAGGAGVSTSGS